jgi:hypothetical protein
MIARLRLPDLAPRDRRALLAGAWVLLPVLIATLVVRPWTIAAYEGRASAARERELLVRERTLLADAPGDTARLRLASLALADDAPRLFAGAEAVTASAELARYVTTQAAASGLAVRQADTQTMLAADARTDPTVRADSSADVLRVAIRASGDVGAVVRFLRLMEDGARIVRVERIGISRGLAGTSEAGTLVLTATITGLARSRFVGGTP